MKKIITFIVVFIFIIELHAQTNNVLEKSSVHLQVVDNYNKNSLKNSPSRLFNFNPVIIPSSLNDSNLIFKNSVADESSIFLVFTSENKPDNTIMKVSAGSTKIIFSNQKVKKDKEFIYRDVKASEGVILSYIFNLETSKRNNYISLEDYSGLGEKSETTLLELIYFPLFLNDIERIKVETYLSVKFGISLLGKSDYISSDDVRIWDYKKNSDFNYRVTGIGRDDRFKQYQKQSFNSADKGLVMSLDILAESNSMNKGILNDMNFLIWGDNGKAVNFVENRNNGIEKIERIWKVQTTKRATDSIVTQLVVNPNELFADFKLSEGKSLWLIQQRSLTDSVNVIAYKAIPSGDVFIVDKVNFDPVSDSLSYFSFRQAPDFFALLSAWNEKGICLNKANINLKMIGGYSPYHISIKGLPYKSEIQETKSECVLQNIPSGKYAISITDSSNRVYHDLVTLTTDKPEIITIEKDWILNKSGSCTIDPILKNSSTDVKYEWLLNDQVISVDSILNATDPGQYKLNVTNSPGCSDQISFELSADQLNMGEIVIYPNPVLVSETYCIKINLAEKADIEIDIIDNNGKILKVIPAGLQNKYEYSDKFLIPGTYLINVKLDNRNYWNKIAVQ